MDKRYNCSTKLDQAQSGSTRLVEAMRFPHGVSQFPCLHALRADLMRSQASAKITDVVLPIVEVSGAPPNLKFERLLGSGFLVGKSLYLITAGHVIKASKPGYAVALRVMNGQFVTIQLDDIRFHITEDIAICRVSMEDHVESWLYPTAIPQFQTVDFHVWGYPEDVLYDSGEMEQDGRVLQRPELIYMKGYIRRRVSHEIFGFPGTQFYEINDSAGAGCSGGPLIINVGTSKWDVFGVYMGEITSERGGKPVRSRGYAVRMEAVSDWLRSIHPSIVV